MKKMSMTEFRLSEREFKKKLGIEFKHLDSITTSDWNGDIVITTYNKEIPKI